jgi:hypothetical protein
MSDGIEYEDGFVPEEPHFLHLDRLKTKDSAKPLIGKVVKDIKFTETYSLLLIIFEDGSELEMYGGDEMNSAEINVSIGKKEKNV